MDVEKKAKFRFSSSLKTNVNNNKEKEQKRKEKENFSIDELKQYYNQFMTEYKSITYLNYNTYIIYLKT